MKNTCSFRQLKSTKMEVIVEGNLVGGIGYSIPLNKTHARGLVPNECSYEVMFGLGPQEREMKECGNPGAQVTVFYKPDTELHDFLTALWSAYGQKSVLRVHGQYTPAHKGLSEDASVGRIIADKVEIVDGS